MIEPRGWQQEFLANWLACPDVDYLAAVIPAGGKTIGSLFCAQEFLREPERVLVVLAPTVNVQRNWQDEASKNFEIELASSVEEYQRGGYRGVVLTYQALNDTAAGILRWLSGRRGMMVIADEVHHLCDEIGNWGVCYRRAFEFALRRLAITGTPFRSKLGEFIPFLPLDETGESYSVNFAYDYPSALEDRHVRAVAFHYHDFETTKTVSIDEDQWREWHLTTKAEHLSDADAADLLRTAIWNNEFVCELLRVADQKLQWKRQFIGDAAGLLIASNQDHAKWLAPRLEQISGTRPDILTENQQTTTVEDFRRSNSRWIIAVNKISEGTDIPRLAVLGLLTTKKTELAFRQAVGRIMRRRNPDDDNEAWSYCYIVNHPQLHGYARAIEEWQRKIIGSHDEPESRQSALPTGEDKPTFVYSNGKVEYGGIIARGEEYETELSRKATVVSLKTGYDEAVVADILQAAETTATAAADDESEPLERRIRRLKNEVERLSRRWAYHLGIEPKDANAKLIQRYGCKRDKWTTDQFKDAIQYLMEELGHGPNPSR